MEAGKILVIDDEPSLRHTLTRILRQIGYKVASAADGAEALRLLEAETFDLIYLDIRLPDIDGLQVLDQARKRFPRLPVILLTGHGSLQSALSALRLGASDYLLKPVDPDVLISRTRVVLREQALERRKREIREQIFQLQEELRRLEEETAPESDQPSLSATPPAGSEERFLKRGRLILDLQARRATLGAEVISLPPSTFEYLVVLARYSPAAVDYHTLVTEAQGYQVDASEARELAKWHIHVLRQALEPEESSGGTERQYIHTERGVGYRLLVD